MTAISDLYDGIDSILVGLFPAPTYKELVWPDVPELDNTLTLSRGYGFYIGPKTGVSLTTGRYQQFEADIIVRQTIINRGTDRDLTIKKTAEKTLLEDQFTLVDYFRLNTAPIAKVWRIDYVSDAGIERVFTDKQNYVMITTVLRAVYAEGC
jgi:hypothetical protein